MPADAAPTRLDIVDALGTERSLTDGSAPWTLRFLEVADRQFGGRWRHMTISGEDALGVVLPPHAGEPCRGDRLPLVGPGGATVERAARRLSEIHDVYASRNQSCWSRIADASAAPFSTLILTTAPLDADDYRSIVPAAGNLFHLDGFHRLVGWAWAGRLTPDARVRAWVAGPPVALG
jgi:hypothetical protein